MGSARRISSTERQVSNVEFERLLQQASQIQKSRGPGLVKKRQSDRKQDRSA
jgi:hypothetical protein